MLHKWFIMEGYYKVLPKNVHALVGFYTTKEKKIKRDMARSKTTSAARADISDSGSPSTFHQLALPMMVAVRHFMIK